jgi:molybdenum cofactor cytidylyltransferase
MFAVVPAAGSATRFGSQKLLADVDGEPLLCRTIASLVDGGAARVVVVLGPAAADVRAILTGSSFPTVDCVTNPDPSRGMFSSIQTGLASANGDPILILPGDMPFVRSATVAAVAAACAVSGHVVSPRYRERRGHPIAVPQSLRAVILAAPATSTLSEVVRQHASGRLEIDVDDSGVLRDVDVPADLRGGTPPRL